MALKSKSTWILIIIIFSGLVIGGLLGDLATQVDSLKWLSYGQEFGLEQPIILNLSIIKLTFAFMIKINIASIIGLVIAIIIYRYL